ncbi:MAG: lysophospholipid acyltransferase family protein [Bacteroidia bacterium]
MKKILGYIFTPVHLLAFGLVLIVFHPVQWLCLKLGGYIWHKRSVDLMNFFLMESLLFMGTRCRFNMSQPLPTDRPLIVVANHQSLYDIPPFFWYLRRHHVKFVSKIELAYGSPSISFNLRHGGSVLIDRKDPRQALPAIKKFAEYIEENKYAACIFPEGTRSKTGEPRPFAPSGLKTLLKYAPSAIVVPVTINNAWKIVQYGKYPFSFGERPVWTVHPYIDPKGRNPEEVMKEVEQTVVSAIRN